MVTNFSGVGIGLGFGVGCGFGVGWGFGGMPLNAFGMGAGFAIGICAEKKLERLGGGCGVGFGLGWGFGSAFGCQYRSSKVQFHGFEFNKKVEDDQTTTISSKKQKEAQSIS